MKRTAEGRPFLSWCLIVRNCAKTLEACLTSVRERTPEAEIVIVDTCSSDDGATVEIAKRFADVFEVYTGPNGDWTPEMAAFDDAAAARNRSFALAHGRWLGWIDADDVLPGPEEAERLLRENGRWQPNPAAAAALERLSSSTVPATLEDALIAIDTNHAEIRAIWAPYLYRRHADGTAVEWQERERLVRNDGTFRWVGKGHEVLAPVNPDHSGKIGTFASLLFVHCKDWNDSDYIYSVTRHYNALIKEYDKGDRSSRTCLYLENFSRLVCPWRRGEFLKSAYENGHTKLDRMRALLRLGAFAAENGFYLDMLEAFSGACELRPDLPDPWLLGAGPLMDAKEWELASRWYETGLTKPYNATESLLNPRDLLIGFPMKAAECFRKLAKIETEAGNFEKGIYSAARAFHHANAAFKSEAAGPDKESVALVMHCLENELEGYGHARRLADLVDYMIRNEEGAKAVRLLEALPHTLEDHPQINALRRQLRPVKEHLENRDAYAAFYEDVHTNVVSTEAIFKHHEKLPRVRFAIDGIKKWRGNTPTRILEIGSFDGLTAIPVLKALPNATYVAVDLDGEALVRLRARALTEGVADRLTTHQGWDLESSVELRNLRFDAAIFFEVIEHVPDPAGSLGMIGGYLRASGRIFVSTPWGSGERGHHLDKTVKHDPRGHVRAMTAWDLKEALEKGGFRVLEQGGDNIFWGSTLYAMAVEAPGWNVQTGGHRRPVTFAVPSALWDWNATEVEKTGIGASEETIVYLGRRLAENPNLSVNVFGPVPQAANASEEVRSAVGYWTRHKMDRIDHRGPVIVSRSPGFGRLLDAAAGKKLDKILWLQDTYYRDLSPDTAQDYRKIVTLTDWHKELIAESVKEEAKRLTVIPNFLLAEHFRKEGAPPREPHHFVYASSPDRGLVRLLRIWPRILAKWPDATLDIFYGWEGCMALGASAGQDWTKRYREARTEFMGLRYQPGVTDRGRVNHETLAREFQRASAWLYPTAFAETGCLTAAKVRAAGCVPVTTRYAGLAETGECPQTAWVSMPGVGRFEDPTSTPEAFERYAEAFLLGVEGAVCVGTGERAEMAEAAIEAFEIGTVLRRWKDVLELP